MSAPDDQDREPGGDELLAAEYVLGVLPADDRLAAARRIELDPEFARLVNRWEARLAPLEDYEAVAPPPAVKAALDRRLFPATAEPAPGLRRSLSFWRGLAAAAVLALALYVGVTLVQPPPPAPEIGLVASIVPVDSDVRYLAVYDEAHNRVGLSHVSGARAEGRDFELWIIESGGSPLSLGVIPVGESVRIDLGEEVRRMLQQGAVLAITLEPEGGSPTGGPTGPLVASGDLRRV